MCNSSSDDLEQIQRHRLVWARRPELQSVYKEFFDRLLGAVEGCSPVVELGAGPGFFKEYCPRLLSTDVLRTPWLDLVCDGCRLPFRNASVGAFVLLDVLHHLPAPLQFIDELARVLRPGGRVAMLEPWITPASYLLYRYFHHEDCTLRMNIARPFEGAGRAKQAFDGDAAIPYLFVRHLRNQSHPRLRLIRQEPFLALPYLATFGFQVSRKLPRWLISLAGGVERTAGPLGRWNATRTLLVLEN